MKFNKKHTYTFRKNQKQNTHTHTETDMSSNKQTNKRPREIVFDPNSRKEFINGLHKRKNERRAVALFYKKEKERMKQLGKRRKKREQEKAERDAILHKMKIMSGNVSDEEEDEHSQQEGDNMDEDDDFGFGPTVDHSSKKKQIDASAKFEPNESISNEDNIQKDAEEEVNVVNYDNKVKVTVKPLQNVNSNNNIETLFNNDSENETDEEQCDEENQQQNQLQKRKPTDKDIKNTIYELHLMKNKPKSLYKNKGNKSGKRRLKNFAKANAKRLKRKK